jgi:transcriptional regulator GlxA family with amidase domain
MTKSLIRLPCPTHVFIEDYEKVIKIHEIIMSDLSNPMPTINILASRIAMSNTKFRSLFIAIFGVTIYHYHLSARMELSKELLVSNRHSIVQIAYKVGFNRSQSFAKAFLKYAGQTASEYKLTHSSGE